MTVNIIALIINVFKIDCKLGPGWLDYCVYKLMSDSGLISISIMSISILIYFIASAQPPCQIGAADTPNPRANIVDFGGFYSSTTLL